MEDDGGKAGGFKGANGGAGERKERIFSGIQPSGTIHVGNYVGAIRNWAELQQRYDSFFCIVDYHAITAPYEPAEMQQRIFDAVATNVACGLDPSICTLFVQSQVPEHTELCWLFASLAPLGLLERMTQFKDKARQHRANINAGLLCYPILQAADILLYKASVVPVGEDQVQHVEFSNEIGRKFNHTFGDTFPEVRAHLVPKGARIMALNDPSRKMSKSLPGSYVGVCDEPDEIRAKLRRAVTDVGPSQTAGEMSPGVANLFTLLEVFSPPETRKRFKEAYDSGAIRYSDLKEALADDLTRFLAPMRERRKELVGNPSLVYDIMADGARRARRVARDTMEEVRSRMGLAARNGGAGVVASPLAAFAWRLNGR